VEKSEDRCDKRRFRGFNHSTCKTVLNQLEMVNLRFRKIVVERVTVVKFRVDNRGTPLLELIELLGNIEKQQI